MSLGKLREGLKEKWIAALRSDRYHQVREALVEGDPNRTEEWQFCCLGVLTDVAIKEGCPDIRWTEHGVVILDQNVNSPVSAAPVNHLHTSDSGNSARIIASMSRTNLGSPSRPQFTPLPG